MKNDKQKTRNVTPLSDEERRKLSRLEREARRTERIEKAKLSLEEETREDIVVHAKHVLIEEELAERIDKTADTLVEMKQELRDLKKKHRAIVREIRQELGVRRPVSAEERARRRERTRRTNEYRARTIELIREIEKEHRVSSDEELFDLLPPHKAIMASQMTYTELANLLNERKHWTTFDGERKWTRLSVKRIIEQHGSELQRIGHKKDTLKIANAKRSKAVEDFAIWMRDEILPSVNTDQPYLTIAKELNARGVKTRTGGEWGNVSVKRLLDKIKELSGE